MLSEKLIYGLVGCILAPVEGLFSLGAVNTREPVIFIIGLPRCGSTLLQQLLGQKTNIAFITNLHAKFWRSPSIGALVSKAFKPSVTFTNYESVYGITDGLWGPNEWGWFWRDIIPNSEEQSTKKRWLAKLRRKLSAVQRVQRKPLLFDNVDLLPHITDIAGGIHNSVFIYLHRDPLYVANSVINASIKRYGADKRWYGPVPASVAHLIDLPIVQRVVIQVQELDQLINKQISTIDKSRVLHIQYGNMCSDPTRMIENFLSFIEKNGGMLKLSSEQIPKTFIARDKPEYLSQEFAVELQNLMSNNNVTSSQ